jgi:hypothetical protein
MTPRVRRWLTGTALALAILLLVSALIVALAPWAVRWAATAWAASVVGRPVSAGDVDVSLWNSRIVFRDVAVAGGSDDPPLATIDAVLVNFRWQPLLRGRTRLERLAVVTPVVRIVRRPEGGTSLDDVIAHFERRSASGPPLDVEIERATLDGGHVVFMDRAVDPMRAWEVRDLEASFRDLATRGTPRGSGVLTARVAGGEMRVDADEVRLWPFHARAEARASGVDLAGIGAYVPPDAVLRPVAGRLASQAQVTVDEHGMTLDGRSTLEDLELTRANQRETFITAPRLTLTAAGVRTGGDAPPAAARLELEGSAVVHDTHAPAGGPVTLPRIHGVARDLGVGAETPAPVRLVVDLPDKGRLEVDGTVRVEPVSADLAVTLVDAPVEPLAAYIPPSAPVQVGSGRLGVDLRVRYATPEGLRVAGQMHTSGLELYGRDRSRPFLLHPRLDVAVDGLRVNDGAVHVERLTLSGHPTFVDHSVTPPVRWRLAEAKGTVTDLSWPSGRPAHVRATARLTTGGGSTLEATFRPSPLDVTARVRFDALPAARLNAYLPPTSAVTVRDGTVTADIRMRYAQEAPLRLTGTVSSADLAVHAGGEPIVTDPDARLAATVIVDPGGGIIVQRARLDASPVIAGVPLPALEIETDRVRWPGGAPATLRAVAQLPAGGTVEASGTVNPVAGDLAAKATVRNAALAPWTAWLGVRAPVAGQLDATLTVAGDYRRPAALATSGEAAAHGIRLGAAEEPAIRVERIAVDGLRLVGMRSIHVDTLRVEQPTGVIVRAEGGGFPILTMLGVRGRERDDGERGDGGDDTGSAERRPAIDVDRVVVDEGYARFVDRTTTPPFTEEIRRIAASVTDLDTRDAAPARVEIDAVVGQSGALHLAGQVAPFGEPFVLDVGGTITDFRVPQTNPYLRTFLGWVARRGQLTTEVHYRVEGRQLVASNEIRIENLAVRPAPGDVDRRVGVPLGLVVALLKDARGDIEVSLPVTGDLGRPGFGFGDALGRAARQLVRKLVTGPFRAIGRVLQGDTKDEVVDLEVDPVRFPGGAAALTDEAREHVAEVAEFLRKTPAVRVTLRPVIARGDLEALRREAAVASVQRYQREHRELDFDAAARALAGAEAAAPIDGILDALAAREPVPADAAQQLAHARVAATREALASSGRAAQLGTGAVSIERDDSAGGRVELDLAPRQTGGGRTP